MKRTDPALQRIPIPELVILRGLLRQGEPRPVQEALQLTFGLKTSGKDDPLTYFQHPTALRFLQFSLHLDFPREFVDLLV